MEEKRSLGEYIRRKRMEAGLTQRELATRLFVTESSVSKWERGLSYPDVPIITSICKELNISEHEFFTACDDDKAHAQERAAAIWRRLTRGFRLTCLVSYIIALVVCFICDLAIFQALDWFWIVLTSLALAFCFTNLPAYVRREKAAVCLGAATLTLFLLLLSCWGYVGGKWLLGGLAITVTTLTLPWGWWTIWRFWGKWVLPLCVALTSLWVFLLLAVIEGFTGGGWLFRAGYPLALAGVGFLWLYYLALWLPRSSLLKIGLCTLITTGATPVFNSLLDMLLPDQQNIPSFGEYFSVSAMLERHSQGDPNWVNILLTLILTALALVLVAAGAVREYRLRAQED